MPALATTTPIAPARTVPRPDLGAFRPDVEGLRAVAVLLVVLGHAGVGAVAGGYVGVDVFFVISGFLITSLLLREVATTGRISIARFYARRALRLLPLSCLVLVATLVAARLWLTPLRTGEFARDALASAGYVANLRFAVTGTDYLAADQPPSPFQHFWSLAVEEQFYLVWPLLIIATTALVVRRGTGSLRLLGVALGALILVSFALSVTETQRSAPWAYFGAHTRVWELGAGALLALAARRLLRLPGPVRAALSWSGLAAILAAALIFDDRTPYPGWPAVLPVAGAAAVIAAGVGGRPLRGAGLLLERSPMLLVGRLSYGWYLWHWPVLLIGPAALGVGATTRNHLVLAAGALLLAGISHRLVENPVRHRPALRARPVRGLAVGAALTAMVVAAAVTVALLPHRVAAGVAAPDLRAELAASATPARVLAARLAAGREERLPGNLTPTVQRANLDKPVAYERGCHLDFAATEPRDDCVFGDPGSATTVVLYGDSHAVQWFPAMELLARERSWRLVSLTKSSCSAADVVIEHETLKRPYTECVAFRRAALDRIAGLRPALVVVGSSFDYALSDRTDSWRAGWDRTFAALAGTPVVAVADTPHMGKRVPACLAANPGRITRCDRTRASALRGPEQRRVFAAYAAGGRITVVDPVPWVCGRKCPATLANMLIYRDSNHLTTAYAEMLAPLLGAHLTP